MRKEWEELLFLERLCKEVGKLHAEVLVSFKRRIRQLKQRGQESYTLGSYRVYWMDNDCCVICGTMEGGRDEVYEQLFKVYHNRGYDCTGQFFTAYLIVKKIPNSSYCYYRHMVVRDV